MEKLKSICLNRLINSSRLKLWIIKCLSLLANTKLLSYDISKIFGELTETNIESKNAHINTPLVVLVVSIFETWRAINNMATLFSVYNQAASIYNTEHH